MTVTYVPPGSKVEVKQLFGEAESVHKNGAVTQEKIPMGTVLSTEPMANVGVSVAHTKNLGNYENIKMQVSLHVPCVNNEEALQATFQFASDWVDAKLEQMILELN